MESIETLVPDLMEIDESLNFFVTQHINDLPKELLIEIFRYIRTLKDRHNAMLVCHYWYELLQDPCFMKTCPEILSIKHSFVSIKCEIFRTLFCSSRKFNQLSLIYTDWNIDDQQLIIEFFRNVGKEIRMVQCDDTNIENFLLCFPRMIELKVDTIETLDSYTEFGRELRSVVVESLDPKEVDLKLPIFKQIKSLETPTKLKITSDSMVTNGLNIVLDENLKNRLSKFCELKDIQIVTGANLLRKEPLSVQDIEELNFKVPVQILIENLSCFTKLKILSVEYEEDLEGREDRCQFVHLAYKILSLREIKFSLPQHLRSKLCKTCMRTMLESFPNIKSLLLGDIEYSDPEELLSLIAKHYPDLNELNLHHHSLQHNRVIATFDGKPVLGLLRNLTKLEIFNVALDSLRHWPVLEHLKSVVFTLVEYPRDVSSWKTFVQNSPNIETLVILSTLDREERQGPFPSHKHLEEIVQGLNNLQILNIRFHKLSPECLEPIYTYNRTLKYIELGKFGRPKPMFKLEHVFKLFKRINCFHTLTVRFITFDDEGSTCFYTSRWQYESPKEHIAKCLNQYEDLNASIAFIRAKLMPKDKEYNGPINTLGSKDLSDVNLYLGIDVQEFMLNNPLN